MKIAVFFLEIKIKDGALTKCLFLPYSIQSPASVPLMTGMNWYSTKYKMASLAGRSLRGASRVFLQVIFLSSLLFSLEYIEYLCSFQAANSQCGRVAAQGRVFTNKLEIILHVYQVYRVACIKT